MKNLFSKKWMMTLLIVTSFGFCGFAQGWVVTGVVTDAAGEPLAGVSVVEKGTTNGTITDFDGRYTITVSSSRAILIFSFIGMKPQEIPVNGRHVINVIMVEDVWILHQLLFKDRPVIQAIERMIPQREEII